MRNTGHRNDIRKIRPQKCYAVQQCSDLVGVEPSTVRRWIKQGLPVLVDGKPLLIPGDSLKDWLKARRASRKQKCRLNELYCCRCRKPRMAKLGSVVITPRNAKTLTIKAHCIECDAKMNKGGALAMLIEIKAAFDLNTVAQANLAGCDDPAVNQHLEKETIK